MKANQNAREQQAVSGVFATMLVLPILIGIISALYMLTGSLIDKTQIPQNQAELTVEALQKSDIVKGIQNEQYFWKDSFEGNQIQWHNITGPNSKTKLKNNHYWTQGNSLQINTAPGETCGIEKPFSWRSYKQIQIEISFTIDQNEKYKNFSISLGNHTNNGNISINVDDKTISYLDNSGNQQTFANDIPLHQDPHCWHNMKLTIDFETGTYQSFTLNEKTYDLKNYFLNNSKPQTGHEHILAQYTNYAEDDEATSHVDDFILKQLTTTENCTVTPEQTNTPPPQPTIDVTPNNPTDSDNLLCEITNPSTDPDSDPITYTYIWDEDGTTIQTTAGTTSLTDTLNAAETQEGSTYSCTVTPNDGTDNGPSDSDSVSISSASSYFTFQIDTTLGDGSNTFSFQTDNAVNLYVDWGDGNDNTYTGTGLRSHTYSLSGIYDISIQGTASRISFYEGTEDKLIDILTKMSNGITGLNSAENMFRDTANFGSSSLSESTFFDDISNSVYSMNRMFMDSQFNQPIDNWDTSNVTDMSWMFSQTSFNQDINSWDVSNVTNMCRMFYCHPFRVSAFNQDVGNWDTSNVTNMSFMFMGTPFNQTISNWDTSNVTDMSWMFFNSQFNQPIGNWDVSNVTNMRIMFAQTPFNQDINSWDVSNVTNIMSMFSSSWSFNQPLNSWNTSSVTNMSHMFAQTPFNQDINSWDVSNVTNMKFMFEGSSFNQPLSLWNTSSVTNMQAMFKYSSFNQPLNNWDVSNVEDMSTMFAGWTAKKIPFNQDLNNWDVSSVTNMRRMFENSQFNQDIRSWDVSQVTDMSDMLDNTAMSQANYDSLLIGWNTLSNLQPNVDFGVWDLEYCSGGAVAARQNIIDNYGWNFDGDHSC